MKSYGQQCAVALALDVIGDRWTLLIVRELMVADGTRYTDLQKALPGIASNLLSSRLKEMEANGLVAREDAPPPVATGLFRLTERGQALAPVLAAIGAWGMPLLAPRKAGLPFRSRNLRLPLQLYLTLRGAGKPVTLEIETGDEPLSARITGNRTTVKLGAVKDADLRIVGEPHVVFGLLLQRRTVAEARKAGVRLEGDAGVLERLATRWLGEGGHA
jgi:DNA-binding HxlR family transcriptional regulator